jgi:hypothetical protein
MDELDTRDWEIVAHREQLLDEVTGPRVGDFVEFAGGTTRRVSYIWHDEHGEALSVQTSDGGSFYLGDGYVSMSGSLYGGVKPGTLTRDETRGRLGSVWIFHHDWHTAGGGVDTEIKFRVYHCTENAPR